ncbi:MAG: hypothetical protein PHU25_06590 [Deltaproteobacteria bacterium]|nr:hypothetical protein [Deltaproteobacteria bacterium]
MAKTTAILFIIMLASACGGAPPPVAEPEKTGDDKALAAAEVIRQSYAAMGGIERLRLTGGKVVIRATATADDASFPVEITLGGPGRSRFDYVDSRIAFVHEAGECRRTAFGLSARCTPSEALWVEPMRVFTGLVFPSKDAAQLDATLRLKDDASVDGVTCRMVEVRPDNTNLRVRAAYDKATSLLVRMDFDLKLDDGSKSSFGVKLGDWREVKRMRVPFSRQLFRDGKLIYDEKAAEVSFDAYDDRAFRAPVPPTTDQPRLESVPARRVLRATIEQQAVEVPMPSPAPGGGAIFSGTAQDLPRTEAMVMIHRGSLTDAGRMNEALKGGALTAGRKTSGEAGIILLESPPAQGEPALMVLYIPLVSK